MFYPLEKKLRKTLWGVDAPLYVRALRRNWKGQKLILCFVNPNLSVSNHRGCAQIITHNHI